MFGFKKKEDKEKRVEYIDQELLERIKKIKELIERRSHHFKKMKRALIRCEILFNRGIKNNNKGKRKGRIQNKDTINASIQATRKSINEAKRKFEEKRKNIREPSKLNPEIIKK